MRMAVASVLALAIGFLPCQGQEKKLDTWVEIIQNDPRLKAPVSHHFKKRPSEEEFFGILQKASGVRLSVAPQEIEGKWTFNNISTLNTPVWRIMKLVANNQVIDGYWEKTEDGYVLHGKPKKEFGMAVLSPAAEKELLDKEKRIEEAKAKAAKVREDYAKWHPLGLDPKLHARMSLHGKDPKVEDILQRVSTTTGYKITMAENLKYHDPKLGEFKMTNIFAYAFMEILESKYIKDGRWVKTDDGYRLEGESLALNIPPAPPRARWPWFALGATVIVLAVGAAVVCRRRAKKIASGAA